MPSLSQRTVAEHGRRVVDVLLDIDTADDGCQPAGGCSDFVNGGTYEIAVAGVRYPANASLRPMYDPRGERVRS